MASIRTARVIAAAASVPLAVGLLGGTAHALIGDAEAQAGIASDATAVSALGSGVLGVNTGNSGTIQQGATGTGATNQSNAAQVKDAAFVAIDQDTTNFQVIFSPLW
ncbi:MULTISPECIES: hypothetical protein [Streptomyces]|uniref:Secreted protein n=1 Tax=Streptomyces carpaticus TaxID=285558 RepID=A0ABV4ZIT6_9ACTN|nr:MULTISPECIES: hypothetical protein [Streptomyces]MCK1814835.1 hypothetical protein [Streptomyces sp. XM4011]